MRKYIKLICLLLAVVILSACFSACSGNSLVSLKGDLKLKTEKLTPDSLTLCFMGYGTNGQPNNLISINEMLAELNKKTKQDFATEIKLQWLSYSGYDTELTKLLESGDGPDAFMTYQVQQLREKGLIKDITDLFPKYAPRYFSLVDKFLEDGTKYNVTFENKLYAIPSNDIYFPQYFIMARQDAAEKYAAKGISTFEDYENFMKAVMDGTDDYVPGYARASDFLDAYLAGNGYFMQNTGLYCKWDAKDMMPIPVEYTDEFKTACNLYRKWSEDKLLLDTKGTGYGTFMAEGLVASMLVRGSQVHSISNLYMGNYEYNLYPLYPDQPYPRSRSPLSMVISEHSKKADRVLMFIEWLQSGQENYDLFMYGIKDQHYKLNGEKLDFSGIDNSGMITQWWGSNALRNYVYERPFRFEPDNYKEFQEKCFFKNTMSIYEIYKKFGMDIDKSLNMTEEEKARQKSIQEKAMEYTNTRSSIYNDFRKQWDSGDLSKTLEDMMKENGGDSSTEKLLEVYAEQMKMYKK